jgi:hypothetical protein
MDAKSACLHVAKGQLKRQAVLLYSGPPLPRSALTIKLTNTSLGLLTSLKDANGK